MDKYTIHCTEAQTKKSFELGAPLQRYTSIPNFAEVIEITTSEYYEIPTAEQMMEWLRNEGIHLSILYSRFRDLYNVQCFEFDDVYIRDEDGAIKYFISYKQATLAAIDVALEYLTNNKK